VNTGLSSLPPIQAEAEDGRIRAILPSGEAGSAGDAQMIDLKGGYLMPGLWDAHIHPDYLSLDEMPLADQVTLFGHRLAARTIEEIDATLTRPKPLAAPSS
jgi:predicted amidohydrolase YtcJ